VIIHVKLPRGLHGLAKRPDQPVHLLLRRLVSGYGIRTRQSGKILSKTVTGNEGMEILRRIEVVRVIVPAAHVRPRRRHPLALAEWLEQSIFVQMQKQIVIVDELLAQWSIE